MNKKYFNAGFIPTEIILIILNSVAQGGSFARMFVLKTLSAGV